MQILRFGSPFTAYLVLFIGCLVHSTVAMAGSFQTCPSRAFLTQKTVATTYNVNLVTGDYALLEDDMGTGGKINATGFSVHDQFLYAWSYVDNRLAQIGDDYQISALDMENITDTDFFVGDVATVENKYYAYRRGASYGLYSVQLDPSASDYLQMTQVVDGASMNLSIFDMAFHPNNGFAYSVDRTGMLWRIDVVEGTSTSLGDTGQRGTFGAVYFDVQGNLYFSRNSDGNIFTLNIDSGSLATQLFAIGPSSSTNDGARCALADIVDESNTDVDFGDAPASYGTLLSDNGARHGIPAEPTLFLGALLDGESDGTPAPLQDDTIDMMDDEDGIQFATGMAVGLNAVSLVKASEAGNLSAWIDFDANGTFDASEQIATDRAISGGVNPISFAVPAGAQVGETWARFRLSSSTGVAPTGGVADGEVEDLMVVITAEDSTVNWYPSRDQWATVAFEDNWPFEGDYDMNDLVVYLRTGVYRTNDAVTLVSISGEVPAVGAAYQNGFAIRLPGLSRADIDEANLSFTINGRPTSTVTLEQGVSDAILIVTYNVWNYLSPGEDCIFHHTEADCGGAVELKFEIRAPLATPLTNDINGIFDPFLFATPGAWHGEHFASPPGRSYEIHLKNQAPTEVADMTLFGTQDDASITADGYYYQTDTGLPWALEVARRWDYPREYMELIWAYPDFQNFVESDGATNEDWFASENSDPTFIFLK